jgi:hypothetical protein
MGCAAAADKIREGEDIWGSDSKRHGWMQDTEREAVRDGFVSGPWLPWPDAIIWTLDETYFRYVRLCYLWMKPRTFHGPAFVEI